MLFLTENLHTKIRIPILNQVNYKNTRKAPVTRSLSTNNNKLKTSLLVSTNINGGLPSYLQTIVHCHR